MTISERGRHLISTCLYIIVLLLSLGLIVYISIDTFQGVNFLDNSSYMRFQFWVCMVFIFDFFVELWMAENKGRYFRRRWLFLLLSIPYLNIIQQFHIDFTPQELYFIRFIPLARGALALAIVIGYMTSNRLSSLFKSYLVIVIMVIYFSSLIFLYCEHPVNDMVPNYGAALWWSCMDATTIGSNIYPVTVIGKILGVVLAALGMLMFPLFTVYITNWVQRYNKTHNPAIFDSEFADNNANADSD